jgi:GT2 family glycosyltransferase
MPPDLAVIIPSYNRRASLGRLVWGLVEQDLDPGRFEVVVVLDGSTDGSQAMLSELHPAFELRVVEQSNAGAAAARNLGVREARAPYCLFLDDDVEPDRTLLREHLEAQQQAGGALVTGFIETVVVGGGFAQQTTRFWDAYRAARAEGRPLTYLDCFSGNMSVPTEDFLAAGGFDVELARSEDTELALRLSGRGLRLVYAASARATQFYTKTTDEILRDHAAYGRATIQLANRYPPSTQRLRFWVLAGRDPLAAEVARVAIRVPVPLRAMRVLGRVPTGVPGTRFMFSAMRTYAMHRGAREELADSKRWDAATTGVRILRYRRTSEDDAGSTATTMRAHLSRLRSSGVQVISLAELTRRRIEGTSSDRFTVVITVQGEAGALGPLPAVLAEFGFPWTWFDSGASGAPAADWSLGDACLSASTAVEAARRVANGGRFVAYDGMDCPENARAAFSQRGVLAGISGRRGVVGLQTDLFALPTLEVSPGLSTRAFKRLLRFGRPFALSLT